MQTSLVSVVIPVYNGAKYLDKALQSIFEQTYSDKEVIIVNDGSTDATQNIIDHWSSKHPEIHSITHAKNMGFVVSLNDGIQAAKGNYIARLDADDIWIDNQKLTKQVDFLERHSEHVLIGGGVKIIQEKGDQEVGCYLFPENDGEIRKSLLGYNLFSHSAVVFLKSAFFNEGGYNPRFGFFADADLWLKLGLQGKMHNLQEYLTAYLDKEYNGRYAARDDQIRRKLFLRVSMKWQYRKRYPGILRAIMLAFFSYCYSFLPWKTTLKPVLFKLRMTILGSPYRY